MTVPPPPGSTPPPPPPPPMPPGPPVGGQPPMGAPAGPSNGTAIAALVLGLVSLLCLGPITGIVAIVLGISAKKKADQLGGEGKGQATAGIVLGIIGSILWTIAGLLFIFGVFATSSAIDDVSEEIRESNARNGDIADSDHYTISDVDVEVDSGGYVTYTAYIENNADFDTGFKMDVTCEGNLGDIDTQSSSVYDLETGDKDSFSTYHFLETDTESAECEVTEVRYGY